MKRLFRQATTLALCALTIGCAGTVRYSENTQGEQIRTTTHVSSNFVWGLAAGAAAGALAYHIWKHEDAPTEDAIDLFIRHNYQEVRPSELPRKQSIQVPTREHRTILNELYSRYYGLPGQQKAVYMLEDQMNLVVQRDRLERENAQMQRQPPRTVLRVQTDTVYVERPVQPRRIPFADHALARGLLSRVEDHTLFMHAENNTYAFPGASLVCYQRPTLECVPLPRRER